MATEFDALYGDLFDSTMQPAIPEADRLHNQMEAIADSGPAAQPAPGQVPYRREEMFRFRDPGEDSFGTRLKESGEYNVNALMGLTKDPAEAAKMIATLFTPEGLEQLGDYYKQSYGSVDKALQTARNDPVGFLSDIAMIGTPVRGGGALAGSERLAAAGSAMEHLDLVTAGGAAARTAAANTASVFPSLNPENTYENLLRMSVSPNSPYRNRKVRDQVIKTLLDNRLSPSPGGVERLFKLVRKNSDELDAIIDKADQQGTKIPRSELYKRVLDMRREAFQQRGDPLRQSDLKAIDSWLMGWAESIGNKTEFTPSEVRALRQQMDDRINWSSLPSTQLPPMQRRLMEESAHSMRSALAEGVPAAQQKTQEVSNLLRAAEPLERASARLHNNNQSPLNATLERLAGMTVGASGVAEGSTIKMLVGAVLTGKSAVWRPQTRARVAQMIAADRSIAAPVKRNILRLLMSQGSRTAENIEQMQEASNAQ